MTKNTSNFIKGLAILAVILLHALAYPKGIYHSSQQLIFIALDQLARFCVPGFLIVSGYGLAKKYQQKKLNLLAFIKQTLGKLLPLYLIWSLASILLIKSIPAWSFGNQPTSLIIQLLLGQADYQLYFIPLIVQFYLLFPLLYAFKKHSKVVFIFSLIIQIALYLFYHFSHSKTDRFEYVLCLSWIGYFSFGIFYQQQKLAKWINKLAPILALLSFVSIVASSLNNINHGLDPLPALKFTRLIVIPFALFFNLSLMKLKIKDRPNFLTKWIIVLGKNSYLIFLSHTIGLRLIYSFYLKQVNFKIILVLLAWLGLIFSSYKLSVRKKSG